MATEAIGDVLDGTDLILSIGGKALALATTCKVSLSAETGTRTTKEASAAGWVTKFIKSLSGNITADGLVITDGTAAMPSYDELFTRFVTKQAVTATWAVRNGSTREGSTVDNYEGQFVITALDLDGQAGDDTKYSITLENSGPIMKNGKGLTSLPNA